MAKAKSFRGSPKCAKRQVMIVVRAEGAGEVLITGDFNQWSEQGIRLSQSPDGTWKTNLSLDPGEYQYRLKIDGQWQDHADAQRRVPNPYGSENCVLVVG